MIYTLLLSDNSSKESASSPLPNPFFPIPLNYLIKLLVKIKSFIERNNNNYYLINL